VFFKRCFSASQDIRKAASVSEIVAKVLSGRLRATLRNHRSCSCSGPIKPPGKDVESSKSRTVTPPRSLSRNPRGAWVPRKTTWSGEILQLWSACHLRCLAVSSGSPVSTLSVSKLNN
jgi:hypothetical protein